MVARRFSSVEVAHNQASTTTKGTRGDRFFPIVQEMIKRGAFFWMTGKQGNKRSVSLANKCPLGPLTSHALPHVGLLQAHHLRPVHRLLAQVAAETEQIFHVAHHPAVEGTLEGTGPLPGGAQQVRGHARRGALLVAVTVRVAVSMWSRFRVGRSVAVARGVEAFVCGHIEPDHLVELTHEQTRDPDHVDQRVDAAEEQPRMTGGDGGDDADKVLRFGAAAAVTPRIVGPELRRLVDEQAEGRQQAGQVGDEGDVVVDADAVVHPRAVMVEASHATVARRAVLGAQRPQDEAGGAEAVEVGRTALAHLQDRFDARVRGNVAGITADGADEGVAEQGDAHDEGEVGQEGDAAGQEEEVGEHEQGGGAAGQPERHCHDHARVEDAFGERPEGEEAGEHEGQFEPVVEGHMENEAEAQEEHDRRQDHHLEAERAAAHVGVDDASGPHQAAFAHHGL